jgi:hypothetical protein
MIDVNGPFFRERKYIFGCLLVGLCWLCLSPLAAFAEKQVNTVPNRKAARPYFGLSPKGDTFLAHFGEDNNLYVIKNGGEKRARLEMKGYTGKGISLAFSGDEVIVAWRVKESSTGFKHLYVQRLADRDLRSLGARKSINSAHDVLLPMTISANGRDVYVAWVDERNKSRTIYMNLSRDGGRTFQSEDIKVGGELGATQPVFLLGGRENHIFFHGCGGPEKQCAIFHCSSTLDGTKWSEPEMAGPLKEWAPSLLDAVETDEGPLVFWAGVKGLHCAFREAGKWSPAVLPETEDMDIYRMKVKKAAEKGRIYVLASYAKWLDPLAKPSVYLFRSDDSGRTWKGPEEIRHYPFKKTGAKFSDLAITGSGAVVAVWQDHRLIRGNIYMNYSLDGGKTWLPEDVVLDDEPGKYNDFFPFIVAREKSAVIMWPRFTDDSLAGSTSLYMKEVDIP